MKSFTILIVMLLGLSMLSCEKIGTDEAIRQAENAISAGRIEYALNSCDLIVKSDSLTPTQMCRLAIIYAKISELSDNQDYMANATKFYEDAVRLNCNSDTLEQYIASLDVESQGIVSAIREISNALNSGIDYTVTSDNEEDIIMDNNDPKDSATL